MCCLWRKHGGQRSRHAHGPTRARDRLARGPAASRSPAEMVGRAASFGCGHRLKPSTRSVIGWGAIAAPHPYPPILGLSLFKKRRHRSTRELRLRTDRVHTDRLIRHLLRSRLSSGVRRRTRASKRSPRGKLATRWTRAAGWRRAARWRAARSSCRVSGGSWFVVMVDCVTTRRLWPRCT